MVQSVCSVGPRWYSMAARATLDEPVEQGEELLDAAELLAGGVLVEDVQATLAHGQLRTGVRRPTAPGAGVRGGRTRGRRRRAERARLGWREPPMPPRSQLRGTARPLKAAGLRRWQSVASRQLLSIEDFRTAKTCSRSRIH